MDYKEEIKKILSKLHRKRQIAFALECVNDVKHLLKDPRSLKALEIIEKWLKDEATQEEIKIAVEAAYSVYHPVTSPSAASSAAHATYAAYAAAYAASNAAPNAAYAAYYAAASTAYYAANAQNINIKHYYDKLFNSLSELEREVYEL